MTPHFEANVPASHWNMGTLTYRPRGKVHKRDENDTCLEQIRKKKTVTWEDYSRLWIHCDSRGKQWPLTLMIRNAVVSGQPSGGFRVIGGIWGGGGGGGEEQGST